MKLNTEIKLVFTDSNGATIEKDSTLEELYNNDPESLDELFQEDCTSSGCNNESQNFCDCGSALEDFELTDIKIL